MNVFRIMEYCIFHDQVVLNAIHVDSRLRTCDIHHARMDPKTRKPGGAPGFRIHVDFHDGRAAGRDVRPRPFPAPGIRPWRGCPSPRGAVRWLRPWDAGRRCGP